METINHLRRDIMKRLLSSLLVAVSVIAFYANAEEKGLSGTGYFDFSEFTGMSNEEAKVEVNIRKPLLKLAANLARNESPEAAELIRGLEMVRVRVYSVTDDNREQLDESVRQIADTLNAQEWEQLVRVRDGNANVGVYARVLTDDAISGLVVSVAEKKEAVFVNIVGDVTLDAIADLGKHLDIPVLDKLDDLEDVVEEG